MAFMQRLLLVSAAAWLLTGCADLAQQQHGTASAASGAYGQNSSGGAESTPDDAQRRVGRYTTALAEPADEVSDPLGVYARISYPRQTVRTVGDAIEHTLLRTGWRLKDRFTFEQAAAHYMTLPLPESQRVLGPYPVRTILRILADGSWQWHEDPVRRLTWFTLAQPAEPKVIVQQVPAQPAPAAPEPVPATPTAVQTKEVTATPLFSARDEGSADTETEIEPEPTPAVDDKPICECD